MGLTTSHISSHSAAMRNQLPEKTKYSKSLRIALYQRDRMSVQRLTGYDPSMNTKQKLTSANITEERITNRFTDLHPDFVTANLSVECFVELVEKRWDPETVKLFLHIQPTEDMLVAMLSTCVLHNHYPALEVLLGTLYDVVMKSTKYASDVVHRPAAEENQNTAIRRLPLRFVLAHNLQHLFPIVCHQNDQNIMMAFVEAGLFDPEGEGGTAALRIVAASVIRMHCRALQRYGNLILAPPPQANGAAASVAPTAPEWFITALKSSVSTSGDSVPTSTAPRIQGDGVTAAPIGTYQGTSSASHNHGGDGDSSAPSTIPHCPLSNEELRQSLLDPSSGEFTNVSDAIAPYIAPLVLILSTHKYPGREAIEAIQREALRTAVIKAKGLREVAGWQLYQQQLQEMAKAGVSKLHTSTLEVTAVPLLSPVASLLALIDGPWTADTHRMHSPPYRRIVRLIFYVLTRKQVGLNEDDVNSILAYLPEQ